MKIRVYYEDTDAAGIVYYANYLKFCERARSEIFFSAGLSPQTEEGYFVVKGLQADYYEPAKLGDMVEVETKLAERKRASIRLLQRVVREDTLLFEMGIRLAFVKEGRPAKIPESLYSIISLWNSES
ncbi:YbgC/FadM family acyl-CoA thioesterase [Hydrogenimonas sp. SS33]|uniref:YbgC/FadM family acyl-CoA thioesterase n=1 Tax=Hydrogenimonas leucolamina TaxID=2954236 RepID=UPI00336BF750